MGAQPGRLGEEPLNGGAGLDFTDGTMRELEELTCSKPFVATELVPDGEPWSR
jgi:hypothetical protein